MISEELKSIVDVISNQGKMLFFDGVTEEQINQFEAENNVKLPTQYREWLMLSDGGECFLPAGVQFYGIEHKPIRAFNPIATFLFNPKNNFAVNKNNNGRVMIVQTVNAGIDA